MEKESTSRFQDVGDAALLRLMAAEDELVPEVQEEFYQRHVKYMYGVCKRAFRHIVGSEKIEDLVQDTFVRVFDKAGAFTVEDDIDFDAQRHSVRAWMGKISENIVLDSFRGQPEVTFVDEETLDSYEAARLAKRSDSIEIEPYRSRELKLLEDAFETLTEDEKHVLRITAFWYKLGQKHQRLPNKVMTQLADSLDTNAANVRKIRSRGIATIRAYFEAHADPKSE
jgi:RNA polymerase sigma factor (sigma-70 family)